MTGHRRIRPETPVEHRTCGETGEMGLGREGPVLPLPVAT